MTERLALIFVAGGLGALARYGLALLIDRRIHSAFPWGILAVNITGCFLFGLFYGLIEERGLLGPQVRFAVLIGFAGAFTTFSAFAFDTVHLARSGEMLLAMVNVVLNISVGIALVVAGFAASRAL